MIGLRSPRRVSRVGEMKTSCCREWEPFERESVFVFHAFGFDYMSTANLLQPELLVVALPLDKTGPGQRRAWPPVRMLPCVVAICTWGKGTRGNAEKVSAIAR